MNKKHERLTEFAQGLPPYSSFAVPYALEMHSLQCSIRRFEDKSFKYSDRPVIPEVSLVRASTAHTALEFVV